MQVSALNTIIAAQQARTSAAAARPAPISSPSNASAPSVASEPSAASKQPDAFAPLAFKEAGSTAPRPAANPFAAPVPLGSQIDIRV